MNEEAYRERQRNKDHITASEGFDKGMKVKVLNIDRHTVTYRKKPIRDLGSYERKKFENLLILSEAPTPVRFHYV